MISEDIAKIEAILTPEQAREVYWALRNVKAVGQTFPEMVYVSYADNSDVIRYKESGSWKERYVRYPSGDIC